MRSWGERASATSYPASHAAEHAERSASPASSPRRSAGLRSTSKFVSDRPLRLSVGAALSINGAMPTRVLNSFASALALCVVLASSLASCASWRTIERSNNWTLYAENEIDPAQRQQYTQAIAPAIDCIAREFGPFQRRVSLYVWDGRANDASSGQIHEVASGAVQDVPGIGPARVRAFHARGNSLFGPTSGIYLGAPEVGTIAHELVHAKLAEEPGTLPLWLEEGLACFMGDGYLDGERWVVDGLACWPLRELSEARLDDRELARLVSLSAEDQADVRQNVLAHFVGWAIVFDLYREHGTFDWRAWLARYGQHIELAEARTRLERTLAPEALTQWLTRLADKKPAVRIATAKGLWKLRSLTAIEALLTQLDREQDPLVQIVLSINVLAAAGEMRLPGGLQQRMWRTVWPKLRRAKLDDAREQAAIDQLFASFRWGSRQNASTPLEELRTYWAE